VIPTTGELAIQRDDPAELERAWELHAVLRERHGYLTATALITFLVPAWSVFDYWLQPERGGEFLAIRLAVAVVSAVCFGVLRTSTRPTLNRCLMLVATLCTGFAVAYFTTSAQDHARVYTIGFSLVYWGLGLILMWRWQYMIAAFAPMLLAHLAAWWLSGAAETTTFLGLYVYLVSAAMISTGVAIVRRRLEHQAFVAAHNLERRNRDLAAALATLKDAQERFVATEKLSALGRLIAQLSHEINNPVNVIENNLEPITGYLGDLDVVLDAARSQCRDPDGALAQKWTELDIDFVRGDFRDAITAMAAACDRVRAIQGDLRAFMRGDASVPVEADLNAGVRSTVAMLKRNLGPHTRLVERYGELPLAQFHAGQLNQVTLNLLQNAIDVVGGAGEIAVETRALADGIELSVADTGPGVSPAARPHLFEPFFTTKEVGKGTGLGLATCYQILQAHGGTIVLDEGYARGARFVVRLPLRPPQMGELAASRAAS
jgi:signal transduction histidine kinase